MGVLVLVMVFMFRTLCLVALVFALAATAAAQQPPPPPSAPAAMSRQQLRDEVTRLRAIVQGRAVLPQRPQGCASPEHRLFDFWLGEWDVSPSGAASGAIIAESSITLADQGCVIIENWRPFGSAHGHSLNMYDPATQSWHQTWMSAAPLRTEYRGGFVGGVMSLEALTPLPGVPAGVRSLDANSVRQWGEQFDAAANTWAVTWDLTYRRRAGTR